MAQGPLSGVKIVEFAGIGPGPFCGMLLSDMGADVVRIDRAGKPRPGNPADVMSRGRRSIALNLKDEGDRETALKYGADLFVTKPFSNAEIVEAVQNLADPPTVDCQ